MINPFEQIAERLESVEKAIKVLNQTLSIEFTPDRKLKKIEVYKILGVSRPTGSKIIDVLIQKGKITPYIIKEGERRNTVRFSLNEIQSLTPDDWK